MRQNIRHSWTVLLFLGCAFFTPQLSNGADLEVVIRSRDPYDIPCALQPGRDSLGRGQPLVARQLIVNDSVC